MLYVGTAGWAIPQPHAHYFPAAETHLQRYAATFNAVEINSSFYRNHRRETYERWSNSVPEEFRFAVKISREISHESGLSGCTEELQRFLEEVDGLGKKLGMLLLQLPRSLEFEPRRARPFFTRLRKETVAALACEPRHPSWFSPKADAWLLKFNVARVAADPAPAPQAFEPGGSLEAIYYRLHGSPRMYYSSYDLAYLDNVRKQLAFWQRRTQSVWCMFDNTAASAAIPNALALLSPA